MSENSIMTIADFHISEMNAETAAAIEAHNSIVGAMRNVASALVELCRNLKQMRDSGRYKTLGFAKFEQYTEQACGIKKRQAYYYIQVYERFGEAFLQSNARIGITKLQLLTEVCAVDRADFVAQNDLEGMSVSEVKALIAKNKEFSEQIDMLKGVDDQQRKEIDALEEENRELKNRPVEVAVQQPTQEQIEEAVAEKAKELERSYKDKLKKAKEKERQKADKEKQEAIKKAKTAAKAEAEALYREQIEKAEQEKADAVKKAESMAAALDKNADKELVTASLYFSEAQGQLEKFMTAANEIADQDAEKGDKLRTVAARFLQQYIERLTR